MARTDQNKKSAWVTRVRGFMDSLAWANVLQAAAGIAVVLVGLAAAGGAGWTIVAARQTMHGRMATFVRSAPPIRAVLTMPTEVADNTR